MSNFAFLYATFPRPTETFLRRELRELGKYGFVPDIFSIWRGGSSWEGSKINTLSSLSLISLIVWIPYWVWKKPHAFKIILSHLWASGCPNLQNWNETFWGLAFALVCAKRFENSPYHGVHAVWATMPASAALGLHLLTGTPFSMGAHAYDVFRDHGDWLLKLKLRHARYVRTSSLSTATRLQKLGASHEKLKLIYRSVDTGKYSNLHSLIDSTRLSLLSVGRLVEKKGYFLLINMLHFLHKRNVPFQLTIIGDGPLKRELVLEIKRRKLSKHVILLGHLAERRVREQLESHDALLFNGIISKSGDRDGVPNVILEAMTAGLLILASDRAGCAEAFVDGASGYALSPYKPLQWVQRLEDFYLNPQKYTLVRESATRQVNEKFSSKVNCKKFKYLFVEKTDGS